MSRVQPRALRRSRRRPAAVPLLGTVLAAGLLLPALLAAGLRPGAVHAAGPAAAPAREPDLGKVPAGPLRDAARLVAPSIVTVTTELIGSMADLDGSHSSHYDLGFGGTGFFVSGDGAIVTAAHVAAPTDAQIHLDFVDERIDREHNCSRTSTDACRSVEAQYEVALVRSTRVSSALVRVHVITQDLDPGADGLGATLLSSSASSQRDVALLKVDTHDAPVLLLRTSTVRVGAAIAVEGYPESRQDAADPLVPTVTAGRALDVRPGDLGFAAAAEVVATDATVEHGNSGGPGIDDSGEVVGMVSYGPAAGPNYLVSAADVRTVMQGQNIDNSLGRADRLWRDGLRALADGDRTTASRDFTDCATLASVQVGCRTDAQTLGILPPPAAGAPTGAVAADGGISAGQAAAWLGAGAAGGLLAGIGGTLLVLRLRRHSRSPAVAQPAATFYPSGWGQPSASGGWTWRGQAPPPPPPPTGRHAWQAPAIDAAPPAWAAPQPPPPPPPPAWPPWNRPGQQR